MRILYLHQYFKTPEEGGAIRSYHIAKAMVAKGHQVDLITGHNKKEYLVKRIEGIRVHYLPANYDNSFGKIKRIYSFIRFAYLALKFGKKIKADICYATSTPLTIGWLALRLNKKLGLPYIFEVRDLWPEAPKQLGFVKNKLFLSILKKIEKRVYFRADKIIALSPGIQKGIEEIAPSQKIEMIPNFSNNTVAKEYANREKKWSTFGLDSQKFTLVYTGALGHVNNISLLKEMINQVEEKFSSKVQLVFAGKGKYDHQILTSCEGKKSAQYLGFLNKEQTYDLLHCSDGVITTFLDLPILETNSPNKFFDGLAFGKTAFLNNKGWTKEIIQKHQCGIHFTTSSFSEKLSDLLENEKLISTYQQNAKQVAQDYFDKDHLAQQIVRVVEGEIINTPILKAQVYNQTA